jgi:hypothetical protein
MPDVESQVDYIEDDVLRLIFLSCHPILTPESRAALTLRLVGGLTTAEIARGFLSTESAMGQRISRAKKALSESHAEFEVPEGSERTARLDDVMAVIYLIFNEGYTATTGEEWMRPDLANEAIRLARMLAALAPDEPEVLGLQALLEIQGSRMPARLDEDGTPLLLEAQDRNLWDQLLIRRGSVALEKAEQLAARGNPVGRYFLQASIAAQHARAVRAADTDWRRIAELYDVLARAAPGPGSPCWRRLTPIHSATHRWFRACTGTCSSEPGITYRRVRRSPRLPRAQRTRPNVLFCGAGPIGTGRVGRTRISSPQVLNSDRGLPGTGSSSWLMTPTFRLPDTWLGQPTRLLTPESLPGPISACRPYGE